MLIFLLGFAQIANEQGTEDRPNQKPSVGYKRGHLFPPKADEEAETQHGPYNVIKKIGHDTTLKNRMLPLIEGVV